MTWKRSTEVSDNRKAISYISEAGQKEIVDQALEGIENILVYAVMIKALHENKLTVNYSSDGCHIDGKAIKTTGPDLQSAIDKWIVLYTDRENNRRKENG